SSTGSWMPLQKELARREHKRMRESEVIARLRRIATAPEARGLLDDVAVLDGFVITHDTIAEGVHFLPQDPPASAGWKLGTANLSDLPANGATPAGAGLALLLVDATTTGPLIDIYRRPIPQMGAGQALAPQAHAMMDVSDGLLMDARRMAEASGCAIAIELDRLPLSSAFVAEHGQ